MFFSLSRSRIMHAPPLSAAGKVRKVTIWSPSRAAILQRVSPMVMTPSPDSPAIRKVRSGCTLPLLPFYPISLKHRLPERPPCLDDVLRLFNHLGKLAHPRKPLLHLE